MLFDQEMSREEAQKLADELGIDVEDFNLKPLAKDLTLLTPQNSSGVSHPQIIVSSASQASSKVAGDTQRDSEMSKVFHENMDLLRVAQRQNDEGEGDVTPRRMTFMQFNEARQRGMSRRLSAQVKDQNQGEFGALEHDQAELDAQFSQEIRRNRVFYLVLWCILASCLCAYIVALQVTFWSDKIWSVPCIQEMLTWLMVYNVIQGLHIVRAVVLIIFWKRAKDPAMQQIKLEAFFGIWLFLFEVSWLIYGNTFIYDDYKCQAIFDKYFEESNFDVSNLRATCLSLIIYGYFLFLGLCFIILFYVGAYLGYKSYAAMDKEALDAQEAEAPLLQSQRTSRMADVLRQPSMFKTMATLRTMRSNRNSKATTTTREASFNSNGIHSDKQECGLCYETFNLVDQVFFCQKMHVFHKVCYEERPDDESDADQGIEEQAMNQMKNLCPTCNFPMILQQEQKNGGIDHRYSLNNK